MPEISRFLGIIISMYYNDHNPPHFHVRYGNEKAIISISSLSILDGKLPSRITGLVVEWASMHQSELMEDWELAKLKQNLKTIEPLV
ncbi:MAG: DUF4160 domain-containing protein [Leptospiraceae bacterium]|nr:DUF4160 domain-containing protein [Leptospiraceae bacterium]